MYKVRECEPMCPGRWYERLKGEKRVCIFLNLGSVIWRDKRNNTGELVKCGEGFLASPASDSICLSTCVLFLWIVLAWVQRPVGLQGERDTNGVRASYLL